jgi:exodeoxyribonuclease V beta subunit
MSQILNALTLPLKGLRLIEASAGTGKTYTITSLYLRLLLGHGDTNSAHSERLSFDSILVVTFTEAATAELRGRIRDRIHQARLAFICNQTNDSLVQKLMDASNNRDEDIACLLRAEQQMDEAAIFTIHGFCQRMLTQNAFESGSLFEQSFVINQQQLLFSAVADFWRNNFYDLDRGLTKSIQQLWKQPSELLDAVKMAVEATHLTLLPKVNSDNWKDDYHQQLKNIKIIKQSWLTSVGDIAKQVNGHIARYTGKNFEKSINEITDWAQSSTDNVYVHEKLITFSYDVLVTKKSKNGDLPTLNLFHEITSFFSNEFEFKSLLLTEAIKHVKARLNIAKEQTQQRSFADLLVQLERSLTDERTGSILVDRMVEQFPLAMIDEFQDTDPLQYNIFKTLYAHKPNAGLLMIGDPKQAIYAFRGADIFTYIEARRQVDDHYTLDTNWRSTTKMVNACNHFFQASSAPFIYSKDISFHPVKAIEKKEVFTCNQQEIPALNLWYDNSEPVINKASYESTMANSTANCINKLLTSANEGNALIGDRPVKPSDIAILVRTGSEAKAVRQELSKQNIASVYMSNKDSVFSAQEATDLQYILTAILNPESERHIRAALASSLFNWSAFELDKLSEDERLWEDTQAQFKHYQQHWENKGVLAMLRGLLNDQKITQRLLGVLGGERKLTDVLHLAELLQENSLLLEHSSALLRWLSEKIANVDSNAEEQLLRLESDRQLVQVVTLHKSKGLEYNIVFMPFVCSHRPAKTSLYHEDGHSYLDLTNGKDTKELADGERLAEDLRLLYVGLTRGVYATWMGLAPIGQQNKANNTHLHNTAIGYLLQGGNKATAVKFEEGLKNLCDSCDDIVSTSPMLDRLQSFVPVNEEVEILTAQVFDRVIEKDWRVTSYSALSYGSQHSYQASDELPGFDLEVAQEKDITEDDGLNIFTFPKGAGPGTFMHALFEEIDFPHANGDVLRDKITQLMALDAYEEKWLPTLEKLVSDVLDTQLPHGPCLRNLTMLDKKVEMEFFLPIKSLNAQDLNRLCKQHDPLSAKGKDLHFDQVKGMLKGFIDLVFTYNGKYYVLDYKSNFLGDKPSDYHTQALEDAMVDHRYDLQYQLYTLALHRLLQHRIPNYSYEKHIGGCYYLFLRGMNAANVENFDDHLGVFFNKPSDIFINQLDSLFKGESVFEGATS